MKGSDLRIPILGMGMWCPFCKDHTIMPNECEINCFQISRFSFDVLIIHKKCNEEFRVSLKVESITTSIEGEIVNVR